MALALEDRLGHRGTLDPDAGGHELAQARRDWAAAERRASTFHV